jgi:hypothetical protein
MLYQNILITNLEDGVTTFVMTLDLSLSLVVAADKGYMIVKIIIYTHICEGISPCI